LQDFEYGHTADVVIKISREQRLELASMKNNNIF